MIQSTPDAKTPFRILALDGGGLKGAFTAAALSAWEEDTQLRIQDHFDLVAGTSTGGILAIGLGLGLRPEEMLQFYLDRGPIIFPVTRFGQKLKLKLRQIVQPKFSQNILHGELKAVLCDRILGESKLRLVIPAYDTLRGRIYVFKTAHNKRFRYDINIPAADVALATAAAPTYFKAARVYHYHGAGYVDGGVWSNNPALTGVVEAASFLGKRLDQLHVLSVVTTYEPGSVASLAGAGLFGWGARIVKLIMNAQAEASWKQAMLLVGRERFHRVDCITRPGEYGLDSADQVSALAALGRSRAIEKEILEPVKSLFLNGVKVEPFTPHHEAVATEAK